MTQPYARALPSFGRVSARLTSSHGCRKCIHTCTPIRTFSATTSLQREKLKPKPGAPSGIRAMFAKQKPPTDPGPQKDMPFFKFNELLLSRFVHLAVTSTKIKTVLLENGLEKQQRPVLNEYRDILLAQPASTYTKAPNSVDRKEVQPGIPTFPELKEAYETGDKKALDELLITRFALFAAIKALPAEQVKSQMRLADLTRPADWYPTARQMKRELHLHVGPTNSGKTYHALQRLKQAKSGTFAGPLRLLAHEVYDRLNKEGIPCNLSTGEERRYDPTVELTSSTIEMLNLETQIDVMVIDEIQMIADPERGAAWTSALLGAPAKEIHMCGEASVVDLVTKIAESMGETVEVHHYTRLGGLKAMDKSLEDSFKGICDGDAVVTFSRIDIFNVKQRIEETTGFKCAVVYGALPPETRAQQAALFNDPESEYKVIVASDAIGMGLNLSIKRVVFETIRKFNGETMVTLPIPQVKQIAGRAGRFKSKTKVDVNDLDPPKEEPGYATTLRPGDLPFLHEALATPTIQLQKAVLRPPVDLIEAFARPYRANYRLSSIMDQFKTFAQVSELYALQDVAANNQMLDLMHPIKNLNIRDRVTLLDSPVKTRVPSCVASFLELAEALGAGERAEILDLKKMNIDLLDEPAPLTAAGLKNIEELHQQLALYMWLNLRFPGVFCSLEEVVQLKAVNEEIIAESLDAIRAKKRRGAAARSGEYVNAAMMFAQRQERMAMWHKRGDQGSHGVLREQARERSRRNALKKKNA